MMRIVVDTNVIISALVFGGLPRRILDLAAEGIYQLYCSEFIRNEVERVLEEKFAWSREQICSRTEVVFSWATMVRPSMLLASVKDDPDDDRILECAIEAKADAIISGDHHLLHLGSFQNIPIQTPRQFLESQRGKSYAEHD